MKCSEIDTQVERILCTLDLILYSAGLRHGQTRQLPGAPAIGGAKIEKIRGAEEIQGSLKFSLRDVKAYVGT